MSQNSGPGGKQVGVANSSRIVGGGFDVQGGAVLSGNVLSGNIMPPAQNKNRLHTSQGGRGAAARQQQISGMRGTMIVGSNKFGNDVIGGP